MFRTPLQETASPHIDDLLDEYEDLSQTIGANNQAFIDTVRLERGTTPITRIMTSSGTALQGPLRTDALMEYYDWCSTSRSPEEWRLLGLARRIQSYRRDNPIDVPTEHIISIHALDRLPSPLRVLQAGHLAAAGGAAIRLTGASMPHNVQMLYTTVGWFAYYDGVRAAKEDGKLVQQYEPRLYGSQDAQDYIDVAHFDADLHYMANLSQDDVKSRQILSSMAQSPPVMS